MTSLQCNQTQAGLVRVINIRRTVAAREQHGARTSSLPPCCMLYQAELTVRLTLASTKDTPARLNALFSVLI